MPGVLRKAKGRSGLISRVLSRTAIYLALASPPSSSHATRARAGPTHRAPICACSGWGLPSRRVAATLVVSYTTVSAFPFTPERRWESSFLRHFPSGHPAWLLASILPCGARTFLTRARKRPSRGRLARFAVTYCSMSRTVPAPMGDLSIFSMLALWREAVRSACRRRISARGLQNNAQGYTNTLICAYPRHLVSFLYLERT